MLIARIGEEPIDALDAQRGPEYCCPKCGSVVTLKKGSRVVAHFAHRPPSDCTWDAGETPAHRAAKRLIADEWARRGVRTQLECVASGGARRADVMVWSRAGLQIAFELQHSTVEKSEIENRATSYAAAGIAQIWIIFLKASIWQRGVAQENKWLVEKYPARDFERWVHGFNGSRGMWMYDPDNKQFWLGRLKGHINHRPETVWYSEGGEEHYGGGSYWSKRYRELTLEGPYRIDQLLIGTEFRKERVLGSYRWPECRRAYFEISK